jgi:hypothetical protein
MDQWWQLYLEKQRLQQQQYDRLLQQYKQQLQQQQEQLLRQLRQMYDQQQHELYQQWRLLKVKLRTEEAGRRREELRTEAANWRAATEEVARLRTVTEEQTNTLALHTDALATAKRGLESALQHTTSQQQQIADLRSQLEAKDRHLQQVLQLIQQGVPTSAAPPASPGRSLSAVYQGGARISLFGPDLPDMSMSVQQPAK